MIHVSAARAVDTQTCSLNLFSLSKEPLSINVIIKGTACIFCIHLHINNWSVALLYFAQSSVNVYLILLLDSNMLPALYLTECSCSSW